MFRKMYGLLVGAEVNIVVDFTSTASVMSAPLSVLIEQGRKSLSDDNSLDVNCLIVNNLIKRARAKNEAGVLTGLVMDYVQKLNLEKIKVKVSKKPKSINELMDAVRNVSSEEEKQRTYGETLATVSHLVSDLYLSAQNMEVAHDASELLIQKIKQIPNYQSDQLNLYASIINNYILVKLDLKRSDVLNEIIDLTKSIIELNEKYPNNLDKSLLEGFQVNIIKVAIDNECIKNSNDAVNVKVNCLAQKHDDFVRKNVAACNKSLKQNSIAINRNLACLAFHQADFDRVERISRIAINAIVNEKLDTKDKILENLKCRQVYDHGIIQAIFNVFYVALSENKKYAEIIEYFNKSRIFLKFNPHQLLLYFNAGLKLQDESIYLQLVKFVDQMEPNSDTIDLYNQLNELIASWDQVKSESANKKPNVDESDDHVEIVCDGVKTEISEDKKNNSSPKVIANDLNLVSNSIFPSFKQEERKVYKRNNDDLEKKIIKKLKKKIQVENDITKSKNKSNVMPITLVLDADADELKYLDADTLQKAQTKLDRGKFSRKSEGVVYLTRPIIDNDIKYRYEIKLLGKKGDVRILGRDTINKDKSHTIIFDKLGSHAAIDNKLKNPVKSVKA